MRFANTVLSVLLIFAAVCFARTDDEEIERLKSDFKQVKVVAQIKIEKVEIESEWGKPREGGGYTSYRFTGTVIEAFKGKFTKGDPIVFYSVIEGQPYESVRDLKLSDSVRFLEFHKNKFGLTNLSELENSGHRANETNLAAFRKLRRRR